MQEEIVSRDNARIKRACHIARQAAAREESGLFFAEGVRLCCDIAQYAPAQTVFITARTLREKPECVALLQTAAESFVVSEPVAEKLASTKTSQGVFALFAQPEADVNALRWANGIVFCESLQDPSNIGAIVRSAAGLGLGGVVLSPGCADAFSPKAVRASMGTVMHVPLVCGCPADEAVRAAHEMGALAYAAALQNSVPLAGVHAAGPFLLMIGNEGAGLSQQAIQLADMRVCIPMQNGVESLNAAVAAAVMMFALQNGL